MAIKINNKLTTFFSTFYHNISNNYISESHESSTFESFKAYFYSGNNLFTKKLRKQGMALSAQAVTTNNGILKARHFLIVIKYYISVISNIIYKFNLNILKIKIFLYTHFNKILCIIYLVNSPLRLSISFVYCGDNNMFFTSDFQQDTPLFLMKKHDVFVIDQVNKVVKDATEAFAKQDEHLEMVSKIHLTQRMSPAQAQAMHKSSQNPQLIEESTYSISEEQSSKLDPRLVEHSFKDLTTTNMPTKNKSAILNPEPVTLGKVYRENLRFGLTGTFGVGAVQALEIPSKVLETTAPILPHIYQNPIVGETIQITPIKFPRKNIMNADSCCIS